MAISINHLCIHHQFFNSQHPVSFLLEMCFLLCKNSLILLNYYSNNQRCKFQTKNAVAVSFLFLILWPLNFNHYFFVPHTCQRAGHLSEYLITQLREVDTWRSIYQIEKSSSAFWLYIVLRKALCKKGDLWKE